MKFLRYGLAIALVATVAVTAVGCSKNASNNSDGAVAATVNGKEISVAAVNERFDQTVGANTEMFQGTEGPAKREELRQEILDRLIETELVVAAADKLKVAVTDKELDAKLKEVMKSNGIKDKEALKKVLSSQKMSYDSFIEDFSMRVRIEKLGKKLTEDLKVGDKEIEEYYNANKAEFATKDQVHVMHILVQEEDKAVSLIKELNNGADFAELAKKNSIDPGSKDTGGEMPMAPKDNYVPEFAAASWALEPGQITKKPVKTDYGFHIIKLVKKEAGEQKTFEESKKQIEETIFAKKKQEALDKWLADTKKKAKIVKLLKPPTTTTVKKGSKDPKASTTTDTVKEATEKKDK